jgi:hypothetical protein
MQKTERKGHKKKKEHIRQSHYRRVRFGKNKELEKVIVVPETLVNSGVE